MAAAHDASIFVGLSFWGTQFLPRDVLPSLENIRSWAFDKRMITEPGLQLLTREAAAILRQHFDLQDKLTICVDLYQDPEGGLVYYERPHLPIRSLIRRGTRIQLVYWAMRATVWTAERAIKEYGEVRLGFWYPDTSPLEFCSESTARLVVPKFKDLYDRLSVRYPTAVLHDGSLDITVDGEVTARFFKSGRLFDVELG